MFLLIKRQSDLVEKKKDLLTISNTFILRDLNRNIGASNNMMKSYNQSRDESN